MEVKNLIDKALALRETDINTAKAYIITGKTLFPQNFNIHFTGECNYFNVLLTNN